MITSQCHYHEKTFYSNALRPHFGSLKLEKHQPFVHRNGAGY